MAILNLRPAWASTVQLLLRVFAWFFYVWIGLRLIHVHHSAMERSLQVVGALATQVVVFTAGAIVLAFLLRSGPRSLRNTVSILIWMALIVVGHYVAFIDDFSGRELLRRLDLGDGLYELAVLSVVFALFLAMPFLPGIEIALVVIALWGVEGAAAVFVAANLGLNLAFLVGRALAHYSVGTKNLRRFWPDSDVIGPSKRSVNGLGTFLRGIWPRIERHRYIALGFLLNLPGNSAVGGGGGIAMACGLSGRFSWPRFLLTVAVATAPVPILIVSGVLSVDLFR